MRNITIDILPQKKSRGTKKWWRLKRYWIPGATLALIVVLAGLIGYLKVLPTVVSAKAVMQQVEVLKQAGKDQDIAALKAGMPELQTRLDSLQSDISWFAFSRSLPWVGGFYGDSQHLFAAAREGIEGGQILVEGVEPYGDILGFKGSKASVDKPSEERIAELTLLMPSLLPVLDKAQVHFENLKTEMDKIDVSKYPRRLGDVDVRATLAEAKSQVTALEQGMKDARPVLEVLPSVMGAPNPRTYLILFQNDKELRPTGGFITSVAYINFNKGKFTVSDTGDIYTIDKGKAFKPMPAPIRTYLKVPQWNMRDTNFSPDFAKSMEDFQYYYTRSGDRPIDGIIALDTQLVEEIMKLTGPLMVPGHKKPFSAEPMDVNGTKVPQVVYQLEMIAEKSGLEGDARKGVLGDLMQVIIKKILSEPATKWPAYLDMILQQGQEKHVLLNFHDRKAQNLAEERNFAGRISPSEPAVDYLHINDANLAGLKSNFYLKQEAKRDIAIAGDGTVTEKLTVTYTNTGKFDGWLNATARNYVRVYVPQGSTLIRSAGGDQKVASKTDLGKTVFDNFVQVKPLQSRTVTFEYKLPFKMTSSTYQGLVQKQPGAQNWQYTTTVNGTIDKMVLDGDKRIELEY